MKNELPENLIAVSYHGEGKPQKVYVKSERIAARRMSGGCVAMYRRNGTPVLTKPLPGCRDRQHAGLNVANIVCIGTPELRQDWREVTQAARDIFEREFYGATYKEMEAA